VAAERSAHVSAEIVDGAGKPFGVPAEGRLLVVLGLMATGKSTIARRLGARLGLPVRDSDDEIEAATHHTVRELSAEAGAAAMHEREAQQLLDVIGNGRPCVAAAAASVVDDERCLAALRGVDVVWLRARLETMLARFAAQPHRPTFGLDPEELLRRQLADRSPRYASVADVVVDVDGRTPDDLIDEILRHLPPDRGGGDGGSSSERG
jgi:shikimate kinase/3-dehydroquinate synthase